MRPALLTAAGCVAVAAAILSDPGLALWAKALTDPFVHSTSAGGAVSALLLAAAGALRFAWRAAPAPVAGSGRMDGGRLDVACWIVLPLAVLVGAAVNLVGHFVLLDAVGLSGPGNVFMWSGSTNTSSEPFHSHAGKAALDLMFSPILQRWAPGFDYGAGLAGRGVAGWIGVACGISMTVATLAALAVLPSVATRWGTRGVAVFALASIAGIKAIADGGLLAYPLLPCLAVIGWMAAGACGHPRLARSVLVAGGVAALASVAVAAMIKPQGGAGTLLALGGFVAALAGLAIGAAPGVRTRPRLGSVLTLAFAAVVALQVAGAIARTPLALLAPLPDDARVTVVDLVTGAATRSTAQGRSAYRVYLDAGDDPLKPRRTLIADAGAHGTMRIDVMLAVSGTVPPRRWSAEVARVVGVGVAGARLEYTNVPILFDSDADEASAQRNFFVLLHVGAAALRASGPYVFAQRVVDVAPVPAEAPR